MIVSNDEQPVAMSSHQQDDGPPPAGGHSLTETAMAEAVEAAVIEDDVAVAEALAVAAVAEPAVAKPAGVAQTILHEPPMEGDLMWKELVEVRDTRTARGFGVFALHKIEENSWVGDYTGEVLTQAKYLWTYPQEDADYLFSANEDYNIDASDASKSRYKVALSTTLTGKLREALCTPPHAL